MTSSRPPVERGEGIARLSWCGAWVALAALAYWTATSAPAALVVAAVGVSVSLTAGRIRHPAWAVGSVALVFAIVVAFQAHRQVIRVLDDWDGYWTERVAEIKTELDAELDRRQVAGEAASDALAALWEGGGPMDREVSALRERAGAAAIALYDPQGTLVVWDGVHRGKVPEDVRRGIRRHAYRDLPLFGYLYVTSLTSDGSVAMTAYLLRAALPEGLRADARDLVARFYEESGERIRITEEDPGFAEVVWDLALDDRLLSVVLETPDQVERAERIMGSWSSRVAILLVIAWVLLAVGGPPTAVGALSATGALMALAVGLPFGHLAFLQAFFETALFDRGELSPIPVGRMALVGAAGFALISVLPRPRARLPAPVIGLAAAAAFPLLLEGLRWGAGPTDLAGSRTEWVAYEIGVAALLSLAAGILLAFARDGKGSRPALVASLALAVLLAASVPAWIATTAAWPAWAPALWAAPVALAAVGLTAARGWRGAALRWAVAIVLGGTLAVPAAWTHRFEARVTRGLDRLETLRTADQPELEDALVRFGFLADSLDRAGALEVSVIYDGWLRSGLAELGHPVWLQLHRRDGSPGEGLRVGLDGAEPAALQALLAEGWARGGVQLHQLNSYDARYVLTTLLEDDDLVSVVAPPFSESSGASALAPLLRGASRVEEEPLTVLPILPGGQRHPADPIIVPARGGWQLEIGLDFEGGRPYHAHYLVDLPTAPLAIARASLLLVINLALFLAFWGLGRTLLHEPGGGPIRWSGMVISFRARVTLALFGFFALANAIFGTVAYRTLDQASRRSAQVIAERVVGDAAGWYRTLSGEMERLATQVGAELLEYRDGALREGSVDELVELGLYEGWVPYEIQQLLEGQEIEQDFTETNVGRWEYVTAYHRLPDGDVLAAQVPLQAGSSALQTTDLIELLGFVFLVGAALSLVLAMMAGRALTRPIRALLVASESVGDGDLDLQLPDDRTDEFGAVFRAFNRMVARVRRARTQLVRTSKRTKLIMDESAVGVVALNANGNVTMANPRAEELLGVDVVEGEPLPGQGELGDALTPWLQEFLDGPAGEATSDFQAGERRVRVRVRRLGTTGPTRGAVVAMDDVTDELRAERVLAWGEMARQVAHEVKNPLTPIKLSIQHVRRAWDDGRPDFEEILVRNADAMLSEIDRLAGIAQSFSRFGAPGDNSVPLEGVSLPLVVGEVMALYGGASGGVLFEQDVDPTVPLVVARPAELKEVLVNLLENARLAGEDGTRVAIAARSEGEEVVLDVVDDGHGIPEDILPRIFEPQFSTRSTGTGLGLAIVQRVVRAWGGSIAVHSEVGEGTTVSVTMRIWRGSDDDPGSTNGQGPS